MNEEIQILLKELVDAVKNLDGLVEAVNSPDWWIIILTVINTITIIVIACIQICMQKQQTQLQEQQNLYQEIQTKLMDLQVKSQEYGVYRPLYEIIRDVNRMSNHLLTRIYEYFAFPVYRVLDNKFLLSLFNEINTLNQRLDAVEIDFSLKFSRGLAEVEDYSSLIADMRMIVQQFIYMEQGNHVEYLEERGTSAAIIARRGDVSVLVDAIVRRITSTEYKEAMGEMITDYLSKRNRVLGCHTLEKIAERCKID